MKIKYIILLSLVLAMALVVSCQPGGKTFAGQAISSGAPYPVQTCVDSDKVHGTETSWGNLPLVKGTVSQYLAGSLTPSTTVPDECLLLSDGTRSTTQLKERYCRIDDTNTGASSWRTASVYCNARTDGKIVCQDGACVAPVPIQVICGNGVVEVGEVCDDGNTNPIDQHSVDGNLQFDTCSADCKGEETDGGAYTGIKGVCRDALGNTLEDSCTETAITETWYSEDGSCKILPENPCLEATYICRDGACVAPVTVCGNGVIEGTEQCDGADVAGAVCPAGTTGSIACSSDCTLNTGACVGESTSTDCPTCVEGSLQNSCEGNVWVNSTCREGELVELSRTDCSTANTDAINYSSTCVIRDNLLTLSDTSDTTGECLVCGSVQCIWSSGYYYYAKPGRSCPIGSISFGVPVSGPNCPTSCVDYNPGYSGESDGGYNINMRGLATSIYSDGHTVSLTDSCLSSGNLIETWCVGPNIATNSTYCPAGTTCSNGACVAS